MVCAFHFENVLGRLRRHFPEAFGSEHAERFCREQPRQDVDMGRSEHTYRLDPDGQFRRHERVRFLEHANEKVWRQRMRGLPQ